MKLKAPIIAVSAALLSIYSAALVYEGFIEKPYSGLLTHPFMDRPAAERGYFDLAPNAPIATRKAAAQRLVQGNPSDPEAWMAVSYVDWLEHGRRLTPAGVAALDRSYSLSFFDRADAVWRVGFALDNWTALTPQLRQQVGDEADAALSDWKLSRPMRTRLQAVRNPAGQLAARIYQWRRPS